MQEVHWKCIPEMYGKWKKGFMTQLSSGGDVRYVVRIKRPEVVGGRSLVGSETER